MSDIDEMVKLYKEIQENYIKALERENEELRKQREKDSLKIEELEKEILIERGNKYIKNIPSPLDDKTVIGPGNGWGYPINPIWTTNNTSPVTYQYNTTTTPTYSGTTGSAAQQDTVGTLKQAYHDMTKAVLKANGIDFHEEYKKMLKYQETMKNMQKEVEDDN